MVNYLSFINDMLKQTLSDETVNNNKYFILKMLSYKFLVDLIINSFAMYYHLGDKHNRLKWQKTKSHDTIANQDNGIVKSL